MKQYNIQLCVIDGMPETHATRDFARRYDNSFQEVYLNFFNENQRGTARWDKDNLKVEINRTEALDASRAVIREGTVTLPPRSPAVEEFAQHMACDAKVLEENEETGSKKYKYLRTGENHYSMAFTYALWPLRR